VASHLPLHLSSPNSPKHFLSLFPPRTLLTPLAARFRHFGLRTPLPGPLSRLRQLDVQSPVSEGDRRRNELVPFPSFLPYASLFVPGYRGPWINFERANL
jgi:hypothetical protein